MSGLSVCLPALSVVFSSGKAAEWERERERGREDSTQHKAQGNGKCMVEMLGVGSAPNPGDA